jgi:hypothetical protein
MQLYEYLSVAITITSTIAILQILKIRNKGFLLSILIAYFSAALILLTIGSFKFIAYFLNHNSLLKHKVFEFINSGFSIIELIFFTSFIRKIQPLTLANKTTKLLTTLYVILFIGYFAFIILYNTTRSTVVQFSIYLNIFEYTILLISCLFLFYSVMYKPIEATPIEFFSLLIVSSLFIYISFSLPFLIIAEKINKSHNNIYNSMFATHYFVLLLVISTLTTSVLKKKSIFYA